MKNHNKLQYPKDRSAIRPYRLWNVGEEANIPHRCYKHLSRALHGALGFIYESPHLRQLQVYNVHTAKELGVFYRSAGQIKFTRTPNGKEET